MKTLKSVIALGAWLCLLCSHVAGAQALVTGRPPAPGLAVLPADSSLLRPARLGQAFPYAQGVNVELSLFRRVRAQGLRADTLLDSKNRRIDTLTAQLHTSEQRYLNCAGALRESVAAGRRKDATIDGIYRDFHQFDKVEQRSKFGTALKTVIIALLSLGGGVLIGTHL